jgi:hypothetical protein
MPWPIWRLPWRAVKKRSHPLLPRLIAITDLRLPFAEQVAQLRQQRQWLIDLAHLLDPTQWQDPSAVSAQRVAEAVRDSLHELAAQVMLGHSQEDQRVLAHIEQTLDNHWWGLFQCYDVEGLPRTNNDLEHFLRRLKMGQRRITGRKNVHDFILRYGRLAACIDYDEPLDALFARLQQVSHQDFLRERQGLSLVLLREQKRHRFRHHRTLYLHQLEECWAAAAQQPASP